MSWFPALRKRVDPYSTGANSRVNQGDFGKLSPQLPAIFGQVSGPYRFHEGFLFTPGTGNWVFEDTHELPIQCWWGWGMTYQPNAFNPRQPMPYNAPQQATTAGLGGLTFAQLATQPLYQLNENGGA